MVNYFSFFVGAIVGFVLDKIFDYVWGNLKKYLYVVRKEKKIADYNRTISSEEYILFQNRLLEAYYGKDNFVFVFDSWYPVVSLKGNNNLKFPFDKLNLSENLSIEDKNYVFKTSRFYKAYKRLVGNSIKRPLMQGYMLEKIIFDTNGCIDGLSAWVGTYEENVYTSHILEYEIFRLYKKYGSRELSAVDVARIIQKEMPLRNDIHRNNSIRSIIETGCSRASLLGVQMLVVFRDKTNAYKVLVIKRSQDVAARPGFIQFVPSGGFEVFENSDLHSKRELIENFSVKNALFREYIEEVFGEKEFEYGQGGETINKVNNIEYVKEIHTMLDNGTAHMEFLGSVMDLTGLRHELSFVLLIDDIKYCENIFRSNSESKKIERYSFDEIEDFEEKNKINPSSAALWKLFKDSQLYADIIRR